MELTTVAITGIIVSVLTSLFKTVNLKKSQRSVLALVMSILGGVGMTLINGETLSVDTLANTIVATFAAAQVVYVGVLKNTSLNGSLEAINIFSSKNKDVVSSVAKDAENIAKVATKKKAPAVKSTTKTANKTQV
jgi:hypothetical protein